MKMFKLAAIACLFLLGACGALAELRKVEIEKASPAEVAAQLAKVHGTMSFDGYVSPPPITRTRPDDNTFLYTIAGRNGGEDATIRFTLSPKGQGTVIEVAADIPRIEAQIDGTDKVLSEFHVQQALIGTVRNLGYQIDAGKDTYSAIQRVNESIAFVSLATDPKEVNRLLALAKDMDALGDHESQWNADAQSDWASADSRMDDTRGAMAFGEEAQGTAATGTSPDAFDPSPEGEWGSPTD